MGIFDFIFGKKNKKKRKPNPLLGFLSGFWGAIIFLIGIYGMLDGLILRPNNYPDILGKLQFLVPSIVCLLIGYKLVYTKKNIKYKSDSKPIYSNNKQKQISDIITEDSNRIVKESYEIILKTNNPETFFSRCDLILNFLPSEDCNSFINSYDKLQSTFLYNFKNKIDNKLLSLKTDKAKMNNLDRFKSEMEPHLSKLTYNNKNLYREILNEYNFIDNQYLVLKNNINQDNTGLNSLENIKNIPEEIIDLLWFKNGPWKNIDQRIDNTISYMGYNLTFSFTEEPSVLDINLPIEPGIDNNKIGYYPAYKNLNPIQRYQYLNWLRDISKPIDISYVFIFYYGLERFLLTDKWLQTCKIISVLQKYHDNASFNAYSSDALLITALRKKESSILQLIDMTKIQPLAYASIKAVTLQQFNAEDIINFAKFVGWTNDRYIKKEYNNFLNVLEEELLNNFSKDYYPIDSNLFTEINKPVHLMIANYSLDLENRHIEIPDILSHKQIKKDLYNLLDTTHNKLKLILREERKNKTQQKNK